MPRFVAGVGTGLASMVSPLYVSENSPRAIRGALTGMYVFAIVLGIMLAFWINYGAIQNLTGMATYIVPLSMQALPPILLISSILFCPESPRFLAKKDMWERASAVLSKLRNLPEDHPYVLREMGDIRDVLESERNLIGDSSWWSLNKEIWTVPSNRKRVLISIALMICQQLTGTNGEHRRSTRSVRPADCDRCSDKLLRSPNLPKLRPDRQQRQPLRNRHLRSRQASRRHYLPNFHR
jgi:MFS family permease